MHSNAQPGMVYLVGAGGITAERNGDVVVCGHTFSDNFPTTPGVMQTAVMPAGRHSVPSGQTVEDPQTIRQSPFTHSDPDWQLKGTLFSRPHTAPGGCS